MTARFNFVWATGMGTQQRQQTSSTRIRTAAEKQQAKRSGTLLCPSSSVFKLVRSPRGPQPAPPRLSRVVDPLRSRNSRPLGTGHQKYKSFCSCNWGRAHQVQELEAPKYNARKKRNIRVAIRVGSSFVVSEVVGQAHSRSLSTRQET